VLNYLVEWWEGGSVPEVQVIRFTSEKFPAVSSGLFNLQFGPQPGVLETTGTLSHLSSAYNVRSELMSMGYDLGYAKNFTFTNVMGDVRVSRSSIPDKGYQWSVTFVSEINQGDQVPIIASSLASTLDKEKLEVIEVTSGQRSGGFSEVQFITIRASGTNDTADLGGWFRLSFNGSQTYTTYLPIDADADDVERALNQLSTLRTVSVTRNAIHDATGLMYAGFQWTVVFSEDIGNQPAILLDSTLVWTTKTAVSAVVYDGNNALGNMGKLVNTYPGEAPQNYHSKVVPADWRSYTIDGLIPGNTYYVAVSAVNAYGTGPTAVPVSHSSTPPKQVPQPPTSVSVDVHPGSASTLDVTFGAPLSNGGSPVLSYRIELATDEKFTNPIYDVINCPAGSSFSVFQITTAGLPGDPVVDGYFGLTISRNRTSFATDYIPYDATAMLSDEEGGNALVAGITATIVNDASTITTSIDATQVLFKNDRLQFQNQRYPGQIFTVVSVSTTTVTLNSRVKFDVLGSGTMTTAIYRVYGGRGTVSTSKIACTADASLCSPTRRQLSGSMQAKIESIPEAVIKGVSVDRDDPDLLNGVTWRVTFLDAAQVGALNFNIELTPGSNQVKTLSGAAATVTVTNLLTGVTNPTCEGKHEVPKDKALALNQYYFARVFAQNEIGYSLPQISATSQKPFVVPGAPTSVVLSVFSQTSLRVTFNAPADDGGDTITKYRIDYSTSSNFASYKSVEVKQLAATPFTKTIDNLTPGVRVYVRVSAYNNQGYGDTAASVPTSLNPYQPSDAPTQVYLAATSDTMLTVSWRPPAYNGGDTITKYRVQWDVSPTFNSAMRAPDKDERILPADQYSSYTIQYLSKNRQYYVRVFAVNSAGEGTPGLTSPAALPPSLQVPGRPHTIAAVTGTSAGTIALSWQTPRIPAHGFPCSGTVDAPNDCPAGIGGGVPQSNGGSPITEYEINFNDLEDFSGFDTGKITTTQTAYTLKNLTPDRTYFIRILARNAQGAGRFCQFTEPNCLVVENVVSAKAKAL
jgi:hypothetical protein